ncbi:MAG: hypothetical protein ACYC55_05050 [Candidatus Geothermincolia bacterium]
MQRFLELFDSLGVEYEVLEGKAWVNYSGMVMPIGPAKFDYSVSDEEARFLLSRFRQAFAVRFSDGFTGGEGPDGWFALICRDFKELSDLSKNSRKMVRRGFKNCRVERLDARFVADNGYDVFSSAVRRYKGVKRPEVTEPHFRQEVMATDGFDDIVHYWGAFQDGHLIGLQMNYIFDKVEVFFALHRLHPDYLKCYPSHNLFYTMSESYLRDDSFEYVNAGCRSLLHETHIQDFLMETFRFEKASMSLQLSFRPYFALLLAGGAPIKGLLGNVSPRVGAVYKLREIGRRCA